MFHAASLLASALASSAGVMSSPCDASTRALEDVLPCYDRDVERQPLIYTASGRADADGVSIRSYLLTSQSWSPQNLVTPALWRHDVTIYVPKDALPGRALVMATNGVRTPEGGGEPHPNSEMSPQILSDLARRTRMAVVVIGDLPNQALTWTDDGKARSEDFSVAHSWRLFMDAPDTRGALLLHVPMAAAISRAMTLAQREFPELELQHFVVSGMSKRGWASWHVAIADQRVEAIVPFVIDALNLQGGEAHIRQSYGGNLPIAHGPYIAEGVSARSETPEFGALANIQDPLAYLGTRYANRLAIPKYIVNASGDDFFVPDGSQLYYRRLPGAKALRMAPNSSHGGIAPFVPETLATFLVRLQQHRALPQIQDQLELKGDTAALRFRSNERPVQLRLWSAINPTARDFRYACGVRYQAAPVPVSRGVKLALVVPKVGWSAAFLEATYADGFVATSQTYILGREAFPKQPQPSGGGFCQTLPVG